MYILIIGYMVNQSNSSCWIDLPYNLQRHSILNPGNVAVI